MSEPKNQHIISQCYLKQFVDPNVPIGYEPYVWIFEKGSKKGKKKAPINILSETDFYTLKTQNGEKNYIIEKTLSRIESDYASIFQAKIKKKLPLNNYEHIILCAFVAAMFLRTQAQKENTEAFYDQIITKIEAMEKAHGVPPKASLKWKQKKENAHKISLAQMAPEITKILIKMNLAFLCTNKKGSFITSDTPCHLFNPRLQWQRFYGPGFGQKHVEVIMPLSPEILVCFSWVNNLRGYLEINTDQVHDLNRSVFGHSHQYFIANSPKTKRRWFKRFPLDPTFIWKILINETKGKLNNLRYHHKYHVRRK